MTQIGITERGDAALNLEWYNWVLANKPTILITKNPKKLIEDFKNNSGKSIFDFNVILHATITGLGGTVMEPNVSAWKEQAEYLKENFNERIVIRVDPIVPLFAEKQLEVFKWFVVNTDYLRYRTSIMDFYNHVKTRLSPKINSLLEPIYGSGIHASFDTRQKIINDINDILFEKNVTVEVCGEPGIKCSGCVSENDCKILGVEPSLSKKGQRYGCSCLANKQELLTSKHQCEHRCVYCYWKN